MSVLYIHDHDVSAIDRDTLLGQTTVLLNDRRPLITRRHGVPQKKKFWALEQTHNLTPTTVASRQIQKSKKPGQNIMLA